MTPERWRKVESLLQAAIERGPAERSAFLDDACAGDEALRKEIDSLLASSEQVQSFIEAPAFENAAALIANQEDDSMLGRRLGAYQIISLLGAGGMGEVFLAQDTRLGRKAAIKLLPAFFTKDEERVRRFKQEARAASALNHPNVATIYEIGETGDATYIAMEYVEGQTLSAKIDGQPLESAQIIDIAAQVADALDEAHGRGITHRDIKSENIMLNERGRVKVLDFGLAKIRADSPDAAANVTLKKTASGIVMGTVQYMSPEQALGKAVDGRTDIFSLGAVMYEMATGRLPFGGTTPAETIERIAHGQPEAIARLNYEAPAELERIIRKCLEKDRERRYQTARDLLIDLKNLKRDSDSAMVPVARADIGDVSRILESTPQSSAGNKRHWAPWAVALALLIPLVALSWIHFREQPPPDPVPVRFQILAPSDKAPLGPFFAISPDGRKLAFVYQGRLWVHFLETGKSVDLSAAAGSPFWSPDSRFIGFPADRKLKKVEAAGGSAQTVCDLAVDWGAGSWNQDDVIIFGLAPGPIFKVPAGGGEPVPVTKVDPSRQERTHVEPWFLPDGRHFLYVRRGAQLGYTYYIGSLDVKPEEQSTKPLLTARGQPVYAPSADPRTGYLLFVSRENTLTAQAFDNGKRELTGQPVALAEHVGDGGGWNAFSVSANGVLVFQREASAANSQLTWFDRQGKALENVGDPAPYTDVRLSPDGKQAATVREGATGPDIWLVDLARGTSIRFTSDPAFKGDPVWSPDGSRIAFRQRGSGLVLKASNGTGEQEVLLKSELDLHPADWSRDGHFLLYGVTDSKTRNDIWVLPVDGDRKPVVVLNSEFNEYPAGFSPDGHWISYVSDESGKKEVYVRPFEPPSGKSAPVVGAKQVVSIGAVLGAGVWRDDDKELYYVSGDRKLMAVEIATSPVFRVGVPQALYEGPSTAVAGDTSADGKRSLIAIPVGTTPSEPYSVVLNWPSLLKR